MTIGQHGKISLPTFFGWQGDQARSGQQPESAKKSCRWRETIDTQSYWTSFK
jgi:hypothetical protein